jgi:hypothetical protein
LEALGSNGPFLKAPDPLTSQWKNLNTNEVVSVTNATRVTVKPTVTTTYDNFIEWLHQLWCRWNIL